MIFGIYGTVGARMLWSNFEVISSAFLKDVSI